MILEFPASYCHLAGGGHTSLLAVLFSCCICVKFLNIFIIFFLHTGQCGYWSINSHCTYYSFISIGGSAISYRCMWTMSYRKWRSLFFIVTNLRCQNWWSCWNTLCIWPGMYSKYIVHWGVTAPCCKFDHVLFSVSNSDFFFFLERISKTCILKEIFSETQKSHSNMSESSGSWSIGHNMVDFRWLSFLYSFAYSFYSLIYNSLKWRHSVSGELAALQWCIYYPLMVKFEGKIYVQTHNSQHIGK